jgi:hypothetical protein
LEVYSEFLHFFPIHHDPNGNSISRALRRRDRDEISEPANVNNRDSGVIKHCDLREGRVGGFKVSDR